MKDIYVIALDSYIHTQLNFLFFLGVQFFGARDDLFATMIFEL